MKIWTLFGQASPETLALGLKVCSAGFKYPEGSWRSTFMRLAAEIPEAKKALGDAQVISLVELAAEHFRLFGPAASCPLDLALYLSENPFEQVKTMAQMSGFYKAFGVDPQDGQRPDSLPVALEFLSYLYLKLQNAEQKNLAVAQATTKHAIDVFLGEYLLPGIEAFAAKCRDNAREPFYISLVDLTLKEIKKCP
ncbi:MAG: molecular chaperone TorD family protein [Elusimicrobia bacterium]|nr:molecular chaperone TorD family protein [Elusimicrobiota bacterium]